MLEIIKQPNKTLEEISEPVKVPLSKEDKELMYALYRYVKDNEETAAGLSAVQVGVLKRMCAIRYRWNNKLINYQLVNPTIVWHSQDKFALAEGEGCLSVDEPTKIVPRWNHIKVSAFDCIKNKHVLIEAREVEAVVLQHEIDHMNGKLYINI